jgi:hypothetical protein
VEENTRTRFGRISKAPERLNLSQYAGVQEIVEEYSTKKSEIIAKIMCMLESKIQHQIKYQFLQS